MYGGQLRALHTARALTRFGSVSVLVVNADPVRPDAVHRTRNEFNVVGDFRGVPTPSKTAGERLRWMLDPKYVNVHGHSVNVAEQALASRLCEEVDLVWFLKLRAANVLNRWDWPKSVMDIDDLPSTFDASVVKSSRFLLERINARRRCWVFRRREALLHRRFSVLCVCSDSDRQHLPLKDSVHLIPNGFERPAVEPLRAPRVDPPRIGFIGLYDYEPNRDGVRWFLERCWPPIEAAVPGVRFRLVGKGTDAPDGPKGVNLDALGFVEDSAAEIATWSAMVIPIRLGGGTRIKIADAYSRKCPVVSTSLGAYGYGAEDGKQLRLADTPEQFAAACVDVIQNRAEADAMAERAWTEFLEKWTWDAIAPRVWGAAEDCLRRSRDERRGSSVR